MKLVIIGDGGYGRTVTDLAVQSGRYTEIRFLDDNSTDANVLGTCPSFEQYLSAETELYPAFGNNQVRLRWLDRLEAVGAKVMTLIHDTAMSVKRQLWKPVPWYCRVLSSTPRQLSCGVASSTVARSSIIVVWWRKASVCVGGIVKAENCIPIGMKVEAGTVIENRIYSLKGDNQK